MENERSQHQQDGGVLQSVDGGIERYPRKSGHHISERRLRAQHQGQAVDDMSIIRRSVQEDSALDRLDLFQHKHLLHRCIDNLSHSGKEMIDLHLPKSRVSTLRLQANSKTSTNIYNTAHWEAYCTKCKATYAYLPVIASPFPFSKSSIPPLVKLVQCRGFLLDWGAALEPWREGLQ